MYNLFMTAGSGYWNGSPCEYETSRALREYTTDALRERYGKFDDASSRELKSFPCLFAYEHGIDEPARIGWITRIRTRARSVVVEYVFEQTLPPIPAGAIPKLTRDLDIEKFEIYRTHWALKDVDLLAVLVKADLIRPTSVNVQPPGSQAATPRFETLVTGITVRPQVFRIPLGSLEEKLVSVMMPFAAEFAGVYSAIEAACTECSLRCQKADDMWEASELIHDIFSLLYRSKFVVCDFTNKNPNVLYETGIAHTLGKPVIPIAQHDSDVPFDLRHHRYLRYLPNAEGLQDLTRNVASRLRTLIRA